MGGKAAPALFAVGESSKHIVQIIQLLEERSMSFSFCLNKTDVLVLCGTSLLYQSLELKHESKLMKDAERLINAVLKILLRTKAPGAYDLKRVASMLVTIDVPSQAASLRTSPDTTMAAPSKTSPLLNVTRKKSPYNLGRPAGTTMSETDLLSQQEKLRRMTLPNSQSVRPEIHRAQSRASLDMSAEQAMPRRDHRFSISQIQQTMMRMSPSHKSKQRNLDYLSLNDASNEPQTSPTTPSRHLSSQSMSHGQHHQQPQQLYAPNQAVNKGGSSGGVSISEWEALLGAMDGGQINVYDAIYGGPGLSMTETPTSTTTALGEWSPDSWDLSSINIGDLTSHPGAPQSVLSMSDESLSSGDDLTSSDVYLRMGSEDYQNGLMPPPRTSRDGHLMLDGLEMNLGI